MSESPAAMNPYSTENPLDVPGPWDEDVSAILASAGFPDGWVSWPSPIRRLMCEAWRFGYSSGMADSAKIDEKLLAERVQRAHCVPECTWLQTRQHAAGCET